MKITPRQYEELVAAHFREKGYATEITPCGHDYGVDVFATRGREKLAIQAKMYGGGCPEDKPRDDDAASRREGLL
jgi:restriction system protein